jgi:hypothetical protein
MSFFIITGEKIQQLCDIYLGDSSDFECNPNIINSIKCFEFDNMINPFDNPKYIFCYTHNIHKLVNKIQLFNNPFVLITHNSDENIVGSKIVKTILSSNKLIKWYSQNVCYQHSKLHLLPIGLANSQWDHGNLKLFENPFVLSKTENVYFCFNLNTNLYKRQICYNSLINKLTFLTYTYPSYNLERLKQYKFCICPEGNGVDTHRLWEALYLKVVPIVIESEFTNILKLYNVPLVVLKTWDDFDEINLNYDDYNFDDKKFVKLITFDKQMLKNEFKENEFKENEFKENKFKENKFKENKFKENEFKENEFKENEFKENEFKENEFNENEYFDIVIPLGKNDINIIEKQIEYTKKFVIGYRKIYIIYIDSSLQIDGCITITEDIFPFSIETVSNFHGKISRNNWYFQQLLKLYSGFVIPDILDKFLVIDADTFFVNPTIFCKNNKLLYNYSLEYHYPYFVHINKIIPEIYKKELNKSGICHHMIFDTKYIKEMFDSIELVQQDFFYNVFLKNVSPDCYAFSGASEYELYFNYMLCKHPNKIEIRQLHFVNLPTKLITYIDNITNVSYMSFHYYLD